MKTMFAAAMVLAATASAAVAQNAEIEYPEGALGYGALMSQDYSTAEQQLRAYAAHKNDPARLINYGYVLAKIGQIDKAEKQFKQALSAENVELIVADGRTVHSRELARRALQTLKSDGFKP